MFNIISFLLLSLLLFCSTILVIVATVIGVFVLIDMIKDYKSKCSYDEKEGE